MNSEESLINNVKSGYVSIIKKALEDPNVTTKVLEETIKIVSSYEIFMLVLNCPVLNQDLFVQLYEKSKSINDSRIQLEIINNKYFTYEMYDYYVNVATGEDVFRALINSMYSSEDSYLSILDRIMYCFSLSRFPKKLITDLISGHCSSTKILEKVLTIYPYNNDFIFIECLKSVFLSEELFNKIVNKCLEDCDEYKDVIKEILKCKLLTKDVLINIINNTKYILPLIKDDIINLSICDSSVLLELFKSRKDYISDILKSDKVDTTLLLYMLEHVRKVEHILEIVNYKNTSNEVLIGVLDTIGKNGFEYSDINRVLNSIFVNNPNNDKVLLQIVIKYPDYEVTKKIIENNSNNRELIVGYYSGRRNLSNDDLNNLFNLDGLEENDIVMVLRTHANNVSLFKMAIDFPISGLKVYSCIIKGVYKNKIMDNALFDKLLSKDLTEKMLIYMISNESSHENILKLLEHPNIGTKSIRALYVAADKFREEQQKLLIDKAHMRKREIASKMFNIETEENYTELLRRNVNDSNNISTMLWGPSGVGKSSRVFEVDPTATMLILKNGMLPEEVIGGKDPSGEPGVVYPPHWYNVLKRKCEAEPDKKHILFIDEITNVSDTIKNLVWEVVGARLVNGNEDWPLPENCSIVLAGNRPEESAAVRLDASGGVMPAPLHNRIGSMIEIKFDIDEWQKWALETNYKTSNLRMHPIVYSFCVAHADKVMFSAFNPETPEQPFLSPRVWETLSNAIYSAEERGGEYNHISDMRIKSILGDGDVASAFIEHYEREPIDMRKITMGEYDEIDFPTIEDKLYALGIVIAKYEGDDVTIESFISECLGDEYLSIYKNMKKVRKSTLENASESMISALKR